MAIKLPPPPKPQPMQFKISKFDVGLESIVRWRKTDEAHLPQVRSQPPSFLPAQRPLDTILKAPSLEKTLLHLLAPNVLNPDLLYPSKLMQARKGAANKLLAHAAAMDKQRQEAAGEEQVQQETRSKLQTRWQQERKASPAHQAELLRQAATFLHHDVLMDEEVRRALAILLKG